MKRSNYIFESVLVTITAILGFGALFSADIIFLGAMWLIVLGTLQVVHSLILGGSYWSNRQIRKALTIYWCGVALNFFIMFIGSKATGSNDLEMVTILIFPLILALYLWFITYRYRITVGLAAVTGQESAATDARISN